MRNIYLIQKYLPALLFGLLLTGCAAQPVQPTPAPTVQNTAVPAVPTISPTATPKDEIITLQETDEKNSMNEGYLPNLWTKIEKDKISLYPLDQLADYAYDKAGGLWLVGGFGVIHAEPDGKQSWYSIKNGLPTNSFKIIAISPSDEIWVGGPDNALFRFDGKQWIDEGIKLPEPYDTGTGSWFYSKDITGIDFDQDGKSWVINAGIEIYAQVYGQWLNFPFPKILAGTGGEGYPASIRVISENDITIKTGGGGESKASGYHFDGQTWSKANFQVVDQLKNTRHQFDPRSFRIGTLEASGYKNWPFDKSAILPETLNYARERKISIQADEKGIIWVSRNDDYFYYYNNASGPFLELDHNFAPRGPDSSKSLAWKFSAIPEPIEIGGALQLSDGRGLVGGTGVIWVFDHNHWQKWIVPDASELFTHISQTPAGEIYAATDTGVYKLDGKNFRVDNFVRQDSKPVVVSENGKWGDCAFHRRYTIAANCPGMWGGSPTMHYNAKLLQAQPDGSIIYVNNRLVAKFENGKWKSFLFDNLDIESAAVDRDGFIWLSAVPNGLIRLAPDIFDSYLPLSMH